MKKLIFLFLVFGLVFPYEFISEHFYNEGGLYSKKGNITTSLSFNPSFDSFNQYDACADENLTVKTKISYSWNLIDSKLISHSTGSNFLDSWNNPNPTNNPLHWVKETNFTVFCNSECQQNGLGFGNLNLYGDHISGNVSSENTTIGAKYVDGEGKLFGNGDLYKAGITEYCKGKLYVNLSGNLIEIADSAPYGNGATFTKNITMPSLLNENEKFVNLQVLFNLTGCVATGRTYSSDLSSHTPSVWIYNNSISSPKIITSETKQVKVSQRVVCAISSEPVTAAIPSISQQTFNFSFNLTNNGNKDLTISKISLTQGNPYFSDLTIISPTLPFELKVNEKKEINVSLSIISQPPSDFSLNFSVESNPITDCDGNSKACSNNSLIAVIFSGPPTGVDYIIDNMISSNYSPTDLFDISVTIKNIGSLNATHQSITSIYNCTANPQKQTNPPLKSGATYTHVFSCSCGGSRGIKLITAVANEDRGVSELNYDNNNKSISVTCVAAPRGPICQDFI